MNSSPSDHQLTSRDYVLFVLVVFGWSVSWYALALQVGSVAVPTSLFWRFVIAALVMVVWVLFAKSPMRFSFSHHLGFAAMGLLMFCLNFMMFYYGSQYLISGLLSVIFSLASVFNLAFSFALNRSIPRPRVLFGALLGTVGIALMFWPEIEGQSWTGDAVLGILLCVSGTLFFCTGNQVSAKLQSLKVPVLSASAWGMSYGALFSGVISLSAGHSLAIPLEPVYLGSLVFLALISTVLAFWSYLTLLGRIGPGRAGYASVIFPIFALLVSSVLEGYTFPAIAIAGLVLVLAGNVLVLGGGRKAS